MSRAKIDPELMRGLQTQAVRTVSVVLFYTDREACRRLLRDRALTEKGEIGLISAFLVELPYPEIFSLSESRAVRYISADLQVKTLMNVASQVVGARLLNTIGLTGKGITVAVVDTGLYPHPDFLRPTNRVKEFRDFVGRYRGPYDDNGHGTYVGGILAGNGLRSGGTYRGIAPEAELVALKAMNRDGGGDTANILQALQWIYDHRKVHDIRILCLAFGAEVHGQKREDALVHAVNSLWDAGITVVVAAGNSGPALYTINTPGISSKAITVGSTDDKRTPTISDDCIAPFSSRGPVGGGVYKPDIVAPGVNIVSLATDREYLPGKRMRVLPGHTVMSGTSVSTPIVAGICALILQNNPALTPDQVKQIIRKNAVHISYDPVSEGSGLICIR